MVSYNKNQNDFIACSIHQGVDGFLNHGFKNQLEEDRFYNKQFTQFPIDVIQNVQYKLGKDNRLWIR